MQDKVKNSRNILSIAFLVGTSVSVSLMLLETIFGRELHWNSLLLRDLFYDFLMGFILTIILSTFVDYINNPKVWNPEKDYYRILLGFVGSIPLTLFGIWLSHFLIEVAIEKKSITYFIQHQRVQDYFGTLLITFVVSLLFHIFALYRKLQENKFKEQKIIAGNANAQFESLKNQIDPHFLFNSLNVLTSLIEENPENAQRFTTSLSKIYRYVLEQKDKELVPLREELDFAKTYMKLLTMRFENGLTYSLPEDPIDEEAKVVPLSLQLLLENTIKHNVVSEAMPLNISIYVDGAYLVVSNNLQKKEVLQNGEGVGLKNIVSRYAILTEKRVEISSRESDFKVKIPILTREIKLMKNTKYNEMDAYLKAKKQVKDLKEFYGSLLSYFIVIPILIFINYKTSWGFKWFLFPAIGWGLALSIQAFSLFGYGKKWEERKISELMEKENKSNQTKWN